MLNKGLFIDAPSSGLSGTAPEREQKIISIVILPKYASPADLDSTKLMSDRRRIHFVYAKALLDFSERPGQQQVVDNCPWHWPGRTHL